MNRFWNLAASGFFGLGISLLVVAPLLAPAWAFADGGSCATPCSQENPPGSPAYYECMAKCCELLCNKGQPCTDECLAQLPECPGDSCSTASLGCVECNPGATQCQPGKCGCNKESPKCDLCACNMGKDQKCHCFTK